MKRWFVRVPVYADMIGYVDADSAEDAISKLGHCLCHQCSDHFEIGDVDDAGDASAEEVINE